jgi:adenylate cyclase
LRSPSGAEADATRRRVRSRVAAAFEAEALAGVRLGLRVRRAALAAIAILLGLVIPFPDVVYYWALIGVFVAAGELMQRLWTRGALPAWSVEVFVAADMALLVFAIVYPNPWAATPYPAFFNFDAFVYVFVLLTAHAFTLRQRSVVTSGLTAAAGWTLAVLWVLALSETRSSQPTGGIDVEATMLELADPRAIDLDVRIQEIVVVLIVTGILAVIVARSQRLILRQAMVERERANLARYFAPAMVDRLARRDTPLTAPREAQAAVLFADVVGFTAWAQARSAVEVIGALRVVHGRLEALVFDHGGTLDKFMGDGLMAVFGTPEPAPDDARRAVACARSMAAAFPGDDPFRLAVGLHYGPVVMGDVGNERRMEFAVLGDTVNVASRFEALTRDLGVRVVLSDDVVRAAGVSTEGLGYLDDVVIRGRPGTIAIWTL